MDAAVRGVESGRMRSSEDGSGKDGTSARHTLPYIETHVVDHCNLACRSCGHFSPLSPPRFMDPASFERDIQRLTEILGGDQDDREVVKVVQLLGGEPLLHPDVLDFARAARRALPKAAVHLVTNGTLLPSMPSSLWQGLHEQGVELRVSAYPIALDTGRILALAERYGVRVRVSEAKDRFFTIPLRPRGDGQPRNAFEACRRVFACPVLYDGRLYTCPAVALAELPSARFGLNLPRTTGDYLDLHGDIGAGDIVRYLSGPIPWCRFCAPERLRWIDWGRSRLSLDEWT